jgi:very-short-patch-repair endonuclease
VSRPRRPIPDTPDSLAATLAAEQWGVLDNAELRACGLSRDAVMHRRHKGILHLLYPTVYAWGHAGITPRGRFLAAVKACGPYAALSHWSDLYVWSLLPWDEDREPHVTIYQQGTRKIPGIQIHRTRRPFEIVRFDGIPTMTPARALADLSSMMPFKQHRRAVREGMARKRITTKALLQEPKLRHYLADGYVPTRSELEDAVLDLLDAGGFQRPDVNKPLGRIIPDFRWPEQKLVIEADSVEWHDNPLTRQDDARKQAALEALGERVLRVTWAQTIKHAKQTDARIQEAGAPRRTQ